MKTRCPDCQTVFRITPEQLKARAGKVRCGQCQHVFNALDSLLEPEPAAAPPATEPVAFAPSPVVIAGPWVQATVAEEATKAAAERDPEFGDAVEDNAAVNDAPEPEADVAPEPDEEEESGNDDNAVPTPAKRLFVEVEDDETAPFGDAFVAAEPEMAPRHVATRAEPFIGPLDEEDASPEAESPNDAAPEPTASDAEDAIAATEPAPAPLSDSAAHEIGKATGLILPRETTEIPGYSKWAEGVMTSPASRPLSLGDEAPTRWPYVLVSILLLLALIGQGVFRFRSELATTTPALRPFLTSFSEVFGSSVPLPRHVELISIEVSDLQNDPAHDNLLLLNATLRNRAAYDQSFPALELSLTDTQDAAIARRVFQPGEYLPAKAAAGAGFAANSDLAVHLWIEARDIKAAGYRLYVFYP